MSNPNLDHPSTFVDQFNILPNQYFNSNPNQINLINQISLINQKILQYDNNIRELIKLMELNKNCLVELNALNAKCFYLNSNLVLDNTDSIINQQSFEILNEEYSHILQKLQINEQFNVQILSEKEEQSKETIDIDNFSEDEEESEEQEEEVEEEEELSEEENIYSSTPTPPDLRKMISISNLKLKPMRCATSTITSTTNSPSTAKPNKLISKQKSRYRLSNIYNINPIAYEDSSFNSSTTNNNSTISSIASSEISEDSERLMKNSLSKSYDTIDSHLNNTFEEDQRLQDPINFKKEVMTPPPPTPPQQQLAKHTRSNSLPTSTTSIDQNELFKEFDCQQDYLQFNKLKHFISMSNLPRHNLSPHEDLFYKEINKSLALTPQQQNNNECDVCSIVSDVSYYSPSDKEQQRQSKSSQFHHNDVFNEDDLKFDTYNNFLRKSALNLREQLQHHPLNRHKTNFQSLLVNHPSSNHKFQNPINIVSSQRSNPTTNIAVLEDQQQRHSNTNSFPSSRKLLHEVISRSPVISNTFESKSPPLNTSHNKENVYNFSSCSYDKVLRPPTIKSAPSIATSSDQSSNLQSPSLISNEFMKNFMLTNKKQETPKNTKPPTPQKIKDLKKQKRFKNIPISIPNQTQLKRIPVNKQVQQENGFKILSGSYSNLTIMKNKKYINHGNTSIFNNPIIRNYNEDAIREALSDSLLD
ncbi:hypothetical protein KGF54_004681 [Candida jiufengensis]|uniref:uncharacterized protein n=1 Tax=Candida jiufengensis TaxID=497108 RepID=UPI00222571CC|nr:uncharacterized protein KGF54_004681 [Candida jiufengensis]KAI5951607.1 hypothetical protein KGF54_004681 [Candida jiufengensis]